MGNARARKIPAQLVEDEAGNPAQGLGMANSALAYKDALTPRLRAVIVRQRSYSNAALGEVIASARDSDEAVLEAVAGERQGETDRAPYRTPAYVAMEAGAWWALLGHAKTALSILKQSRAEWLDHSQVAAMTAGLLSIYLTVIYHRDVGCLFLFAYRHSHDDLR